MLELFSLYFWSQIKLALLSSSKVTWNPFPPKYLCTIVHACFCPDVTFTSNWKVLRILSVPYQVAFCVHFNSKLWTASTAVGYKEPKERLGLVMVEKLGGCRSYHSAINCNYCISHDFNPAFTSCLKKQIIFFLPCDSGCFCNTMYTYNKEMYSIYSLPKIN